MSETEIELPEVYVQPGEAYLCPEADSYLRTLLGSCVGVTFWSPRLGCRRALPPIAAEMPAEPAPWHDACRRLPLRRFRDS